jgi:hypothetical protein
MDRPLFSYIRPLVVVAPKETLKNMSFGCTTTVSPEASQKDCLDQAVQLYNLLLVASREMQSLEKKGVRLTKNDRTHLLADIVKKHGEVNAASTALLARYPSIRSYIASHGQWAL